MNQNGPRGTTTHRDLTRWARGMRACAATLDVRPGSPAEVVHGRAAPSDRALRVHRLLLEIAGELDRHASVVRRLDDEIELLRRRRHPGDATHLDELQRRRTRSEARLRAAIDGGTRALVPGGDALDPATILRRLCGASAQTDLAYFGRPAVGRAERLRRISALLTQGAPRERRPRLVHVGDRASSSDHAPRGVVLRPRLTRLSIARRHLLRSAPKTSGVAS